MKAIVNEAHIAAEAGVDSIEHAYIVPNDVLKMMVNEQFSGADLWNLENVRGDEPRNATTGPMANEPNSKNMGHGSSKNKSV